MGFFSKEKLGECVLCGKDIDGSAFKSNGIALEDE